MSNIKKLYERYKVHIGIYFMIIVPVIYIFIELLGYKIIYFIPMIFHVIGIFIMIDWLNSDTITKRGFKK